MQLKYKGQQEKKQISKTVRKKKVDIIHYTKSIPSTENIDIWHVKFGRIAENLLMVLGQPNRHLQKMEDTVQSLL